MLRILSWSSSRSSIIQLSVVLSFRMMLIAGSVFDMIMLVHVRSITLITINPAGGLSTLQKFASTIN